VRLWGSADIALGNLLLFAGGFLIVLVLFFVSHAGVFVLRFFFLFFILEIAFVPEVRGADTVF
jgi:hypothetical protein